MTLKFQHNRVDYPSSLVLDLIVWNRSGRSCAEKGKIDTGADQTVIPGYLVDTLSLNKTGKREVRDVNGGKKTHSKCFVSIQIGNIKFKRFEVIAMPAKNYVILGRDLINLWKLELMDNLRHLL